MNNRRKFIFALGAGVLSVPLGSYAQQATKVWRVGFFQYASRQSTVDSGRYQLFLDGMRELGYVEGRNLVIEARFADGKAGPLPDLAAELVRLKVDIIVATGTPVYQVLQKATQTIPIVITVSADPVGEGFAARSAIWCPCWMKKESIATMTAPARSRAITENARSISCAVRASAGRTLMLSFCAAAWVLFKIAACAELAGLTRTATWESLGTRLSMISKFLALMSKVRFESPVRLVPGRTRLLTNPLPTGSEVVAMTMGRVEVAFCAALVAADPAVTMTSTLP